MITQVIRNDARTVADQLAATLAPLRDSTVLVTGAGGFLGSFFLDVLVAFNDRHAFAQPCRIIAVDNYRTGQPSRVEHLRGDPNVVLLTHDITKPMALDRAPDYVIHSASIASPMLYRPAPLETIAVNVNGTWQMLDLARRGSRSMLYFSSSEVYGDPDAAHIPTPESYRGNVSQLGPRACYDESKRLGETLCMSYFRQYGTPVKIIRPFNVYGPGLRLDDGRIIPDLMQAALKGGPIVLYSDGGATRSFCYVSDYAHACLLVLMSHADGQDFNVGNAHEISVADTARMMASIAADPPLALELRTSGDSEFLTDNPQRRCPDLSKLRTMFGWQPQVELREGLRRTLQSYRQEAAARRAAAE